jgi:hypothetical protein
MTGLLYDDRTLDRLIDLLLPRRGELEELLRKAELGLGHPPLAALARQVMALAEEGFAALSSCFKSAGAGAELAAFRSHFTARARTPSDDVIDRMRADNVPFLPLAGLLGLEEQWTALIHQKRAEVP